MKNKQPLTALLLTISALLLTTPPTTALQCRPRSYGDPLDATPPPEWLELLDRLDALRQEQNIQRVRLKVFDTGAYGNEYPEQFQDREEPLPENWSDLIARLDKFRSDRPTDVRIEISNATYNYNEPPFLIIQGGPALSLQLTDQPIGITFYRIAPVGTELSQLVGCY